MKISLFQKIGSAAFFLRVAFMFYLLFIIKSRSLDCIARCSRDHPVGGGNATSAPRSPSDEKETNETALREGL